MRERIRDGQEAKQALDELETLKRDDRFRHLLDLAHDGDENAIGDLWREFDFDFRACAA